MSTQQKIQSLPRSCILLEDELIVCRPTVVHVPSRNLGTDGLDLLITCSKRYVVKFYIESTGMPVRQPLRYTNKL